MAGVNMTGYFVCLFKEALKAGITRRVGTFCMLESTTGGYEKVLLVLYLLITSRF